MKKELVVRSKNSSIKISFCPNTQIPEYLDGLIESHDKRLSFRVYLYTDKNLLLSFFNDACANKDEPSSWQSVEQDLRFETKPLIADMHQFSVLINQPDGIPEVSLSFSTKLSQSELTTMRNAVGTW